MDLITTLLFVWFFHTFKCDLMAILIVLAFLNYVLRILKGGE